MSTINTSKFKNPYVCLDLEDGTTVQVKLDEEGVVIDHLEAESGMEGEEGREVINSTWKLYSEMEDGE